MTELRIELLEEAIRLTAGDRNKTYGPPTENMQATADLFFLVTGIRLDAQQAALFNVCLKLARLRSTPDHRDSHVDAMAYLGIAFQANKESMLSHVTMKDKP